MASIQKIKSSKGVYVYKVSIRRKKHSLFARFSDKETAEAWAYYKEKILDDLIAFDVPPSRLVTLEIVHEMKREEDIKNNRKQKYLSDHACYCNSWVEILGKDFYLHNLTLERLIEIFKIWKNSKVIRGGNKKLSDKNTGRECWTSTETIRKRLNFLSTLFNFLNNKEIPIRNICMDAYQYLKNFQESSLLSENSEGSSSVG